MRHLDLEQNVVLTLFEFNFYFYGSALSRYVFISLECLFIVIELLLPKSPCLTICDAFCVVLGSNKNGFNRYTLNKQHILSV